MFVAYLIIKRRMSACFFLKKERYIITNILIAGNVKGNSF